MAHTARLFAKLALSILAVSFLVGGAAAYYLLTGAGGGESADIIIPRGMPLSKVADKLREEKVIHRPRVFRYLLRFSGGASRVRAGERALPR